MLEKTPLERIASALEEEDPEFIRLIDRIAKALESIAQTLDHLDNNLSYSREIEVRLK